MALSTRVGHQVDARRDATPHGLLIWRKTNDTVRQVVEFSVAPLRDDLFEVPKGLRQEAAAHLYLPNTGARSWTDQIMMEWLRFESWFRSSIGG